MGSAVLGTPPDGISFLDCHGIKVPSLLVGVCFVGTPRPVSDLTWRSVSAWTSWLHTTRSIALLLLCFMCLVEGVAIFQAITTAF